MTGNGVLFSEHWTPSPFLPPIAGNSTPIFFVLPKGQRNEVEKLTPNPKDQPQTPTPTPPPSPTKPKLKVILFREEKALVIIFDWENQLIT